MQVQVVIGRKIAGELAVPGGVVLVVLHELALLVEIAALHLEGTAAVLIELHHFQDPARYFLLRPPDPLGLHAWWRVAFYLDFTASARKAALHKPAALARKATLYRFAASIRRSFLRWNCCIAVHFLIYIRSLGIIAAQGLQHDHMTMLLLRAEGRIKKLVHHLRFSPLIKGDADPLLPLHAKRTGQIRRLKLRQALFTAFDIAALQFRAGLIIPLAHQKSGPLPGLWVRQNRKTRKLRPLVLLSDMIFVLRIRSQFRKFQMLLLCGDIILLLV